MIHDHKNAGLKPPTDYELREIESQERTDKLYVRVALGITTFIIFVVLLAVFWPGGA